MEGLNLVQATQEGEYFRIFVNKIIKVRITEFLDFVHRPEC
jgi:hypothetical protein